MTRLDDQRGDAERVVLQPLDVRFDWTALPMHWIPGDAMATHMVNVLHLLLPAGERFFVDLFGQALARIEDPDLRTQVIGFIGQEAVHAGAHDEVLGVLRAGGIDPRPYTAQIEWLFTRLLGDRGYTGRRAEAYLVERLATVAAIEHLTSVLGSWVLDARALDVAHPVMLDLLRWHGAEEVEHRSVAFDTLAHLAPGYLRRVRAMLVVAPVLAWLWGRGALFLTRADPASPHPIRLRDVRRLARRGLIPRAGRLVGDTARYLRPGYHPSQDGSTDRAVAYLASSPAATAARR